MTTHESTKYLKLFKERKDQENKQIETMRANRALSTPRSPRVTPRRSSRRRGG